MVCPNCNTELPKGHLYCEKCGTEIQMVPVFEPELEESMNETLSEVADLIVQEQQPEPPIEVHTPIKRTKVRHTTKRMMLFIPLGLFVVFLVVYIAILSGRYFSYDYQYARAVECFENSNYEQATDYIKRAIELDQTSSDANLLLADLYITNEKYDEALAVLLPLLEKFPNDASIYEKLVQIYVIQHNNVAINELISSCPDVQIASQFNEYTAMPPEFSLEEGTYDTSVGLKLMESSNGTIFYTLDGSKPTQESIQYKNDIVLEEGINVVSAIFVNQKGIESESVTKTYQIELKVPMPPLVEPKSGSYAEPSAIKAELQAGEESFIYYTDDGSEPTVDSKEYITPIPMPLGNSHFKFIAVSKDGVVSNVAEAHYNLQIVSLVNTAAAEQAVILTLTAKGELLDMNGTPKEGGGKNQYKCNAAAKAGSRIYYLVEEFHVSDDATESTGRYFGVDVRTGELYNVTINAETGLYEFSLFSVLFE